MRAERRGRVILACWSANRDLAGGAGERVEAGGQAVCCFEAAGLGGVAEGEGQPGSCRCRRAVDPGVRGEPDGEPLQALESALLGELHAAAGEGGRDTETQWRVEGARRAHGHRQGRANGRAPVPGANGGALLPPGLLRVPAATFGPRCGAGVSGAVLATRLGDRSRSAVVLRLARPLARPALARPSHQRAVDPSLRAAVA
jgi:hypothetical protein